METAAEMDRNTGQPRGRGRASLHSSRAQGQFQHRRHADNGRQCRHEGFAPLGRRLHRSEAASGWCAHPRQGEPAGIRARRHVEIEPRRSGAQPYDLTRTPGGSSGGTGAAVAANLALAGTGSDTGQSIRSPSSANNLVGVRPTRGLVSRSGVIPNSQTQDEVGPIARTVTDARSSSTSWPDTTRRSDHRLRARASARSFTHLLHADALKGARIGAMTNLFGKEERHARSTGRWTGSSPGWKRRRHRRSLRASRIRSASSRHRHGRLRGEDRHGKILRRSSAQLADQSYGALVAARPPPCRRRWKPNMPLPTAMNSVEYKNRMLNRDKLRLAVVNKMAELNLDAILYPHQKSWSCR
jgi:Asp-tRNA(Asn)/Glu-tRNA(Gln) amidotransferase A subunit family amidase